MISIPKTNDIEVLNLGPVDLPKYRLLNKAVYEVIRLLRPDLLNDGIKRLLEEYERDLRNLLDEYIQ